MVEDASGSSIVIRRSRVLCIGQRGSEGLGLQGILRDLGLEWGVDVSTDASAARGIASRRGLGKVKNIEVNQLWIQDMVGRGRIRIHKVGTEENLADALTKPLEGEELKKHVGLVGMKQEKGRHEIMPMTETNSTDEGGEYLESTDERGEYLERIKRESIEPPCG